MNDDLVTKEYHVVRFGNRTWVKYKHLKLGIKVSWASTFFCCELPLAIGLTNDVLCRVYNRTIFKLWRNGCI